MKMHEMKLLKEPFEKIKEGSKTIEMRLFDEKRKGIAAGDEITFVCEGQCLEKVRARVKDIYIYEDFASLAASFDARALGFEGCDAEYISCYMLKIYGKEREKECGTCAIELEIHP